MQRAVGEEEGEADNNAMQRLATTVHHARPCADRYCHLRFQSSIENAGLVLSSSSKSMAIALSFANHFNGTRVSLSFGADENPPSPLEQHEIVQALELVKATTWFFRSFARRSLGHNRHLLQQRPPLGHMSAELSPATRVRVMFSCVAFSCRRLVTASGSVYVDVMTALLWAERVMDRVTRGYVRKVQVRRQQRI